MKTIYITILALLCVANTSVAQLTLLSIYHEPSAGDKDGVKMYDSVGVVPKSTGSGMTWDFSAFSMKTGAATTETYMLASAVASSSMFAGATLAGTEDNITYNFYKSSASPAKFEILGSYSPSSTTTFTDPMTWYQWPISMGTTYSDSFSGTENNPYAVIAGTSTTTASGSGNLVLPGGASFSNILQLVSNDRMTVSDTTTPISTSTMVTTRYNYFHTSQKFPLLSVTYNKATIDTFVINSAVIEVNYLLAVGLNDLNFDATFAIYPNPAKDHFNVKLTNLKNEECNIEIYNALGQMVCRNNLGDNSLIQANISLSNLQKGMYIVKTSLGDRSSARRLIVE
jgi:hypothetical protein